MRYAKRFLLSYGQKCEILREPTEESYVSIKRSTSAIRDFGARESHWEGLIILESELKSGEILNIADIKYLVQSVHYDPASLELAWYAVKTNSDLTHQTASETISDDYEKTVSWNTKQTLHAFGEVVTAKLKQREPGLAEDTRYLFQVTRMTGDKEVKMLDRIVFNGRNYKVDAVNDIAMPGVVRIEVSEDTRG